MRKLIAALFLTSIVYFGFGQKSEFGLVFGFGPGYFLKDNNLYRQISGNKFFGFSVLVHNKNKHMVFNPSLSYSTDKYIVKSSYYDFFGITQRLFCLNLDVLLKTSKRSFVRVGLNLNKIDNSFLEISYNNYGGTTGIFGTTKNSFWYSNNELYEGYSSNNFQAGVRVGMSFPFRINEQEVKFDVTLNQSATSIVNTNYYQTNPKGELVVVLSKNAMPTRLLFGIEVKLMKPKKKKKEDE